MPECHPIDRLTPDELREFIRLTSYDVDTETLTQVAHIMYKKYPYPLRRKKDESSRV